MAAVPIRVGAVVWPFLFAALAMGPGSTSAQVYRWVDEKGVTHYGEKPGGTGAQELNLSDPTGSKADSGKSGGTPGRGRAGEPDLQRQEGEFQRRHAQRQRELDRSLRERDRARQASCRSATNSFTTMRRNPAAYTPDEHKRVQDIRARDC